MWELYKRYNGYLEKTVIVKSIVSVDHYLPEQELTQVFLNQAKRQSHLSSS